MEIREQTHNMFKNDEVKSMKIIPFNGEVTKWNMWKERQKSKLRLYDLHVILNEEMTIQEDGKDKYSTEEQDLIKMNDLVYYDLMLSNSDEVCFGLIDYAKK